MIAHSFVGKTAANCTRHFANLPQLARRCQLKTQSGRAFRSDSVQLAVGSVANFPTGANPRRCWVSPGFSVGENSPSYYVGEGTVVPSPSRREVSSDGRGRDLNRRVVLALDLGTTTGWALLTREGHIAHGFASFRPQRFEGGGMRFLRFKRWLGELKTIAQDIHAVYFEEVRRHAGVDAAHVYGGLMATLTTWCEHQNIAYLGVPVGTIKKHATGKGNAGKAEVIAAMRALGHPVTDDNEADALALLHWAIATQEA